MYLCDEPDCQGHGDDLLPDESQDSPTSIRRGMIVMVTGQGKTGEEAVRLADLYSRFVIDWDVPKAKVLELVPRGRIIPKRPKA
jgi:hypothetical protein